MTTELWYSIKNRLEGGNVKARNSLERFFTSLVTSYGCIDIWYRNSDENNTIDCRIFYLQEDSTYTSSALGRPLSSWERSGERPQFWLQIQGTVEEIRASIISFLPSLSQLHDKKRHGEWNFGASQPFEGQGSLVTVDSSGNTIITGRFGDIVLSNNGVSVDWDDITWSFNGCNPTATAPPSDNICFRTPGSLIDRCRPTIITDPGGTCVCGTCCGSWESSYKTQGDCTGCSNPNSSWIEGVDLTSFTDARWNNYFNCSACTGTCVTGNCADGYTSSYPVTQANCANQWFAGVDLSGNSSSYWESYFGCGTALELGCCVLGECFNLDVSVTTSAGCTNRASQLGLPLTSFTPNKYAQSGCTLQGIRTELGCLDVPLTITITVQYEMTLGNAIGPGWFPGNWPDYETLFWWKDCDYLDGSNDSCQGGPVYIMPAVTPGSNYDLPNLWNEAGASGVPSCVGEGSEYPDGCRNNVVYTGIPSDQGPGGYYNNYFSNFNPVQYDRNMSGDNYNGTVQYIFDRDPDYNGTDESAQRYIYRGNTSEIPQWNREPNLVSITKTCCSGISDFGTKKWWQPEITLNTGLAGANSSSALLRLVDKTTGKVDYAGSVSNLVTFSSEENSPRSSWPTEGTLGSYHEGWWDESSGIVYTADKGKIAMWLKTPKGPGVHVNTFGQTIGPTEVTFGGAYYQTIHNLPTESIKATVTVAES